MPAGQALVAIACVMKTSTDHLKTFSLFLIFNPAAPSEELLLRMASGDKGAPQHELYPFRKCSIPSLVSLSSNRSSAAPEELVLRMEVGHAAT